jgi:hypothetical protein
METNSSLEVEMLRNNAKELSRRVDSSKEDEGTLHYGSFMDNLGVSS